MIVIDGDDDAQQCLIGIVAHHHGLTEKVLRLLYLACRKEDMPAHHQRLHLIAVVFIGHVKHFQGFFLIILLAVGEGQFLEDVAEIGRVMWRRVSSLVQDDDGLVDSFHVDETRALIHQAELIVGHTLGIALEIVQSLLKVA